jgi:single-strand DNA-binding protein
MLNHIVLQGRLTRDPELRHTGTGTAVASFTLAVDRDYNREEVDFIACVAWRNSAEFVEKYFHKGDMMIVSGRLQIREYTDKAGNRRRTAEVVTDGNYFVGSKKTAQNAEFTPGEFADLSDTDRGLPF